MKKFSAVLLAFCFIISMIPCVFASENTEAIGNLIIEVKEKLKISDDDYEFDTYYENSYDNIVTYSFSWKSKKEESNFIRAEIKEDGTIVYYNKTNRGDYSTRFLKYSKDEAKEFVRSFLERIDAPKELSEPDVYKSGNNYELYFNRLHEGTEVSGNSISCTVSGDTGEVVRYNLSWMDNINFGKVTPISEDEAKEIYKNKLGYELFYTVVRKDNESFAGLVYKPKYNETAYIDAQTGEIKTYSEFMEYTEESLDKESGGGSLNSKARLSEKELNLLSEIEGLISVDEAVEIAKSIKEFEIDESFKLDSSNIYKRTDGKYTVSIFLTSEKEEKSFLYRNISFDAGTGNLLAYNSYSSNFDNDKKENVISDEEGRKKAEDFLKEIYKNDFSKVVSEEKLNKSEGYYEYKQIENEIKVSNGGISARVDLKTGKITNISYNLADISFPEPENIKSLEEVYEKLLTEEDFTKRYLIRTNKDKTKDAVLIYDIKDNPTYDANTLSEVSSYDLSLIENTKKPEYTDISGHYAESRIKRVVEENIYLEGNELMPEKAITHKEFASLIYMSLSGSEPRPLNDLYKSAFSYLELKFSDEKANEPITRLDAIKLLLDNMGYEEFARIEGIFNCPFIDIEEKDKGYGAIAAGLNLVSTADKLFYKDSYLRRADAFVIIYNYMSR